MPRVAQDGPDGPNWPKWPRVDQVAPMAQSFPKWPKWPGVVQMASATYICWKILGRPANRRANRRCTIHPSWISGAGCITSNATAACLGVKPGATWISGDGATPPPGCSQDLMHGVVKGILHQKIFYRLNLIFWIVMGCGIARFGRRGLKTTET